MGLAVLIVLGCAVIGAIAQLFLKLSSHNFSFNPRSWLNKKLIIGAALHVIGALLFIWALKHGSLSMLYPVFATSYIWICLLASRFLHEPLSKTKWIGIALIIVGVAIVAT